MDAADDLPPDWGDDLPPDWGQAPRYQGQRRATELLLAHRLGLIAVLVVVGTAALVTLVLRSPAQERRSAPPPGGGVAPSDVATTPPFEFGDRSADPSASGTASPRGTAPPLPTEGPAPSDSLVAPPPPPLPTRFGPVTYEAEAPGNTLTGSAHVTTYDGASGGRIVRNIGDWGDEPDGTLRFEGVTVPADGTYTVTFFHVNLNDEPTRTAIITVSGSPPVSVTVRGSATCCASTAIKVFLKAGANSIAFANPNDHAPSIDRIVVSGS